MAYTREDIREIVARQRAYFRTGATLDVDWRLSQLRRLKRAVLAHEAALTAALYDDLGKSASEAYLCDVGPVLVEINEMLRALKRWSRPERHFSGLMCFPSTRTTVYKLPYGVTLLISPFNFPVLLTLGVLAAAIAGGNTAVVKTSSKSAASTRALRALIAEKGSHAVIEVDGGVNDVTGAALAQAGADVLVAGNYVFMAPDPLAAIDTLKKL